MIGINTKTLLALTTLLIAGSLSAKINYKLLDETPPPEGSPAAVYFAFQKAAINGDVEEMKALSTGQVYRFVADADRVHGYIDMAKDIDWSKPVKWAQKIEGDSAKIAIRYDEISSGRESGYRGAATKVNGVWKLGD